MNKVMYRHIRIIDQDKMLDKYIQTPKKMTSIYDVPQKKIGTICLYFDEKEIRVGVSVCSEKDRFVKKMGRKIAYDRCMHDPLFTLDVSFTGTNTEENLFNYCVKELNKLEKLIASNIYEFRSKMTLDFEN